MKTVTEPIRPFYRIVVSVVSEKGNLREINQDSYRIDPQRGLFILADGIGGHQGGEVASRLAVEVLYQILTASSHRSLQETLGMAMLAAHRAIQEMAEEEDAYRGMGSTALVGWVRIPELRLWVGNVGNSRAYLWRNGVLKQLTENHTLFNELQKANLLPPDPHDWPPSTILTQALGSRDPFLAPALEEWLLNIGDRLLFCSDGVSDVLTDDEINEILSRTTTPHMACEELAQAIRHKGAPDDFTAIVVHIETEENQKNLLAYNFMEVQR